MAGTIARGGVTFTWGHRGTSPSERIVGTLQAPTRGWIAAGFNDTPSLAGTRFVIAAVSVRPIRVEMHVALVPEHPPIETLGGHSGLSDVRGKFGAGVSQVSFSLPTQQGEPYPANLARPVTPPT